MYYSTNGAEIRGVNANNPNQLIQSHHKIRKPTTISIKSALDPSTLDYKVHTTIIQ